MSTKSQTLKNLQNNLKNAKVLDLYAFTIAEFRENPPQCIQNIKNHFSKGCFIVRSSALSEDQSALSNAGKFHSVLNVTLENLQSAINEVIFSYGEKPNPKDEVFIQPMLTDVAISGVFFTKHPKTGAPYYVINYNLEGDTTAVTSGAKACHTYYIAHSAQSNSDQRFNQLIVLANELIDKLNNPNLDIEFAFTKAGDLFLFQVRPLICGDAAHKIQIKPILANIKKRFQLASAVHPNLYGKRTILGVMPDWNPAEIIGVRPKPLALSLYKELITDSTWAYQRDNYGYRNLRSFPLLIDLMGLPYIDVRVSFNSFIPKGLPSSLAEKLANYYLDRLEKNVHAHDKVEFDILFSCYTFDLYDRLSVLKDYGFTLDEIDTLHQSLKSLTNSIVHRKKGLWLNDAEKIKTLDQRHQDIFAHPEFNNITKIYWLIEDCKRYGTLPFAGLARAGFIAVQLLKSMVDVDVLSQKDHLAFLNSLDSISSEMTKDFSLLNRKQFLQKYGHLRPGTYDILSPRYDETPDVYFDWHQPLNNNKRNNVEDNDAFRLSLPQMQKIEKLLEQHGLEHDVVGLFSFMKSAVEGREYSKFVFTKSLSDVLSLVKAYGSNHNIPLEDLAFLDIKDLIKTYSSAWDIEAEIKRSIAEGKEKYKITQSLVLPPLIKNTDDIERFELPEAHPNFITDKVVTAKVLADLKDTAAMENAIVFIPSADPGYDWIFTRKIDGFITAYGGVNSHMSIRAGELGIPAVIGAGELLFNRWRTASKLYMDCMNHRVEVIA